MGFDKFIKNQVTKKQREKKKARTTQEKEELAAKQQAEGENYLDAVANEKEDKGAKWTIEAQEQVEEKEKKADAQAKEELEKSKHRSRKDYLIQAATKLVELADTVDWPEGYAYRVGQEGTDKLKLVFKDKQGNLYGRGIKLTHSVVYDVNALHIIVTQAENTVDQLEGRLASQQDIKESPLWSPDSGLGQYIHNEQNADPT